MTNKINNEDLEKVTGGLPQAKETSNHPELGPGYWFYFSIVITNENNRVVEMGKGGFSTAKIRDNNLNIELTKAIGFSIFCFSINTVEIGYNK